MTAITIFFAAGILAAEYISIIECCMIGVMAAVIVSMIAKTLPRQTIALLFAIFMLGAARHTISKEISLSDISHYAPRLLEFEGKVASDPEVKSGYTRLLIKAARVKDGNRWKAASGYVMANLYATDKDLHPDYGDMVGIRSFLYSPLEPTNPGQFSWKKYLARQGVYSCVSIRRKQNIQVLTEGQGNLLVNCSLGIKHIFEQSIQKIHPRKEASVIIGMVLGTYAYLPDDIFSDFTRTGTLHLLAASGYNCYILLLLSAPVLTLLRVPPKIRNLVVILLIAIYLIMVGMKPSLVRASIMASLWLLAVPLKRVPNIKNTFFTAGFIVLMLNPADLFDVGFQLSFVSVGALIWVSPVIHAASRYLGITQVTGAKPRKLHQKIINRISSDVVSAALGTVTITLLTAPLIAYYFSYISLVSLPANIILALGVPLVFIDGLASVIAAHVAPLGTLVGFLGTKLTDFMIETVRCFGSMKYSAVAIPVPNAAAIAGYYIVLFALLSWVRCKVAEK